MRTNSHSTHSTRMCEFTMVDGGYNIILLYCISDIIELYREAVPRGVSQRREC
jgi:hypothetical protein